MLEVFLNRSPNGVNQGLKLIQTLAKKGFEFFLDDRNVNLIVYLLLVLLPVK